MRERTFLNRKLIRTFSEVLRNETRNVRPNFSVLRILVSIEKVFYKKLLIIGY